MRPGTVLDVGCAGGFWLHGLTGSGWRGVGLEPNPAMAEHARREFGLDVRTGTLEACEIDSRFDLIMMIQVLAHFHDLRRALERASDLTRPGGHWIVETWNRRSWSERLFGKHWHEYSPPSVLHWFCPETLRRLGGQFGMEQVAMGRPAKWIGVEHARSLLRYKAADSLAARCFVRLLRVAPRRLRMLYPADDAFWMLLRKQ